MIGGERLILDRVERGAEETLSRQRLQQRFGVDDAAAGGVDQQGRWLHFGESGCVDQVPGRIEQRHVQADDVAAFQKFVKRQKFDAQLLFSLRCGAERIVIGHFRAHSADGCGHTPADAAKADEADAFAAD